MPANRDKFSIGHRISIQQTIRIAAVLLLLFAYYVCTWQNTFNFRTAIDACSRPFCDFAEYYYPMGESIFHTALPVKGFVYSPFVAILFAPFVPLGSGTAILSWGILQGNFILLYVALFRRLIPSGQWICTAGVLS